jgi:hypothetical protein
LLLAIGLPGVAHATTPLSWSEPTPIYGANAAQVPSGAACPTATLCVIVDDAGNVLESTDPGSPVPTWKSAAVDPGHALLAISCASETLCVAVDDAGTAFSSTSPASGVWQAKPIASSPLSGVSCPSSSLCVAVDRAGELLSSTDPAAGVSASWTGGVAIDAADQLTGVSCADDSSCAAIDDGGQVLASSDPVVASSWASRPVDALAGLAGVSCTAPGRCAAIDASGQAIVSADAFGSSPTWSATGVDPLGEPGAVACLAGEQCVLVDRAGQSLISDDPAAVPPVWASFEADAGTALQALACAQGSFCLAVDAGGRAVTTPLAKLPVATAPPAPSVAVVRPQPSIVGIPAVGERLRCLTGVPEGSEVTFAYSWVRDGAPVAGATGSTYRVAAADAQHHLQCQITATDAAGAFTAHSAFVAVPSAGVLASVGETKVAAPKLARRSVSFAVLCSSRATRGCSLESRLTTVETVSMGRVVSLSARTHSARPGTRVKTVSLGTSRVHVGTERRANVSVSLDSRAESLLRRFRRLPATLTVKGTVVGVLSAELLRAELVFSSSGKAVLARRMTPRSPARSTRSSPARSTPRSPARSTRSSLARVQQASTAASKPVLAATPYMGWDTYFTFGGRYSEASVLEQASKLISLGLRAKGYRYVWLDAGWWQGQRGHHGEIVVDKSQWPHGMAWLARTLHGAGLRVGLYTDAGREGCGGKHQGSYGHYRQDVDTFASWGFDAVKVDFCGGVHARLDPKAAYSSFHAAIQNDEPRRPMLLSICNFLEPGQASGAPTFAQSAFSSYTFGPAVGNSWRTDTDVGSPGYVTFPTVLRNLDADAAHPEVAGPGHWNDPDYLGPDQGLSAAQFDTQLSMWAMLAAPLMISDNLQSASPASLAALSDSEVIAIDQDPAGVQGRLLLTSGTGQVWIKPLSDGSRAVALLNRGPQATRIETSASALGMPTAAGYRVRDLWTHANGSTTGPIAALVPGESTVLLKVSAQRGSGGQ